MMTKVRIDKYQVRLLTGILISLITLIALIWYVDGQEVLSALKQVNFIWIVPGLLLLFISLITRAAAWRLILKKRIPLLQSFLVVNAGYFVNTILPFRIGEITRAFLLIPAGFKFWEALPTILLERMFDIVFAVSLFLASLPFLLDFSQGIIYASILASLVLIGFGILFFLVKNQNQVLSWLEGLTLPWSKAQSWLVKQLRSVISGLVILTDPGQLARTFVFMFLSWAIALF